MSVWPGGRPTDGEQLLLAAVQSADDAILTIDLRGMITSWNAGAEHLFGYSAQDAIGSRIEIIVPDDRKPEMSGELARIARGEDRARGQRRPANRRLVECFSAPLAVGSRRRRVQDCPRHYGKEKRGGSPSGERGHGAWDHRHCAGRVYPDGRERSRHRLEPAGGGDIRMVARRGGRQVARRLDRTGASSRSA
jgi:PAS domain S-box-containing protein